LDVDDLQIDGLVEELSKDFKVKCVRGLDLMTVRHYKNEEVDKILEGKDVLLTQKNKTTIQVLHK